MKTLSKIHYSNFPKDYPGLCHLLLPRVIHDTVSYDNALEVVEAMFGFEDQFTPDQSDYFDLLTDLLSNYDQEHDVKEEPLPLKDRLRSLCESAEWSASDLGRFLGLDPTMGNKILRGERKLTADHIRVLSKHFSMQAGYFL